MQSETQLSTLQAPEDERLRGAAELLPSDPASAADRLREILSKDPLNAQAYRLLAQALAAAGGGDAGAEGRVSVQGTDVPLMRAAHALQSGDLETAEIILRPRLRQTPADAPALHMMADFAARLRYHAEAEQLLRLALELAPGAVPPTLALASLLHRQNRPDEALALIDGMGDRSERSLAASNLRAAILARAGRAAEAAETYEESLQRSPGQVRTWVHYGNLLKTMGRRDDCVAALRRAIDLDSSSGEAWWSLSDLKTFRFDESDIRSMQEALGRDDLGEQDRVHLHFALGRAFEQAGNAEAAFAQYAEGNRLRRATSDYDSDQLSAYVAAAARTFTRDFFDARQGSGSAAPDPIFIVGLTRSGSTLIEQILASHPQVEGTFELPTMPGLAERIAPDIADYPAALARATASELTQLGEEYLAETRRYRTQHPFFVDKMPNNWLHVPLIHLALPNARIIDARRHPLACGLSNFKQLYTQGRGFSYDLADLGRYYSDYVRFMALVDAALPGRVYRLIHERLVEDTEAEVRRLLDYLGLPFDQACLRFWETERTVRTASADQVRRPIDREGMDSWRMFEPWLGPLKDALGPVLTAYPDVPPPARPVAGKG